ncbi:alpha-L-fucosidase [Agriterribacter sp.]|uniref:alpha-L-fucosidase n=1 Tax=Agriterribacter sp. TaxID=2821509 RepID=UPI002CFC050A|nr:alpha-L-fucosidase [Agriterribacter sp.]HRP57539.1 alpha-L-fucosidase [Agriterribacter sp.]
MMNKTKSFFLFLLPAIVACTQKNDRAHTVLPSEPHVQWADAEIGAMFHFDVVNYVPDYNWRNWGTHPPASVFNPSKLDTDQWLRAAKAAGAKYAVLVAKHCSGFSLWPTAAHEYSVKHSPWRDGKGDIVADFIKSCEKYDIRPGIYASAAANGYCYVDNPGLVQPGSPMDQQTYNNVVVQQLTELWSNYGKLFEIWFDGGVLPVKDGGPDLAPLLKQLQPDAVVFQGPADANNLIRWIGNEEGLAPYPNWSRTDTTTSATGTVKSDGMQGNPEGTIWCPGEADFPLRTGWQGGWFWKADGQEILSVDQLVKNYTTSVGRNSNMLIGIVVDTSGLVPEEDMQRLTAFGNEIKKRFSEPLASAEGNGEMLELSLGNAPIPVNHVIISEDITKGERIRKYIIEAWKDNQWVKVAEGSSVGHKRIQTIDSIITNKVRLSITESFDQPQIKAFSAYGM